jgi:membrane associated rhomboid family serine protease
VKTEDLFGQAKKAWSPLVEVHSGQVLYKGLHLSSFPGTKMRGNTKSRCKGGASMSHVHVSFSDDLGGGTVEHHGAAPPFLPQSSSSLGDIYEVAMSRYPASSRVQRCSNPFETDSYGVPVGTPAQPDSLEYPRASYEDHRGLPSGLPPGGPPPGGPPPGRPPPGAPPPGAPPHSLTRYQSSTMQLVQRRAYFCYTAIFANFVAFGIEMVANGGKFQPFSCPATCPDGRPCFEDGSPCQANPLLGPSVDTMDRLGAKNDVRIFEYNEWWRIATCNWLHAGLLHLAFNMLGVWRIGVELEKTFGTVRVALLYIFAGLFGTVLSIIFLPGLLSVGASACVFGLVGACWADVIVNFCARCTLRNSGIACLTVATLFNVSIGFTPWYPAVELETRPCPLPSHPSH